MDRNQYAEIIKSAALTAGSRSVMAYLTSLSGFFALPIINPIAGFIVDSVIRIAIEKGELAAFFYYVDMRTSKQGREFVDAALRNKLAQQKGTDEEKKLAEKALIDKFRALAKFTS